MAIPKSKSGTSTTAWSIAGVLVTIALIAFFFWPRSRIELDEHGYDLTTALYRVCNQRSNEGLAKVEALMTQAEGNPVLSNSSRDALSSIIASAKAGRWEEALVSCRQSMEDQVSR